MQKPKMPRDPNQRAKATVDAIDALLDGAAEPSPQDSDLLARQKAGGAKGGKLRAARLTPDRRSSIARKAAEARWRTGP